MAFISPSDRFFSKINAFIFLGRIHGGKLGLSIWFLAIIAYGCAIITDAINLKVNYDTVGMAPAAEQIKVILMFFPQILIMLIWLLVIRLLIEVCFRLLAFTAKQDRSTIDF